MTYKILENPGDHGTTDSILAHLIGAIAIGVATSMDSADKSIVYAAQVAIHLAENRRFSLDCKHYDEVINGCTVRDTSALTQHDETDESDEAGLHSTPILNCMDEVTLSTNKNVTLKIHGDQSYWSTTLADVDVDVDATLADADVEAASANAAATTSASESKDKEEKEEENKEDKQDEEDEEEELRIEFEFAVQEQLASEASAKIKSIDLQEILDIRDDAEKVVIEKIEEMKKGNVYSDLDLLSVVTVRTSLT